LAQRQEGVVSNTQTNSPARLLRHAFTACIPTLQGDSMLRALSRR
jgi:hypothetical protein